MANGITTEWEDLQVKHGNYVEREKQETLAENYLKTHEKLEQMEPNLKDKDFDDLDDDYNDQFTQQYIQQRMKELEQKATTNKFGRVYEITREEYIDQVTNASQENFVVLHLYQDYIQESVLLNQILGELAQTYAMVKFVKIVATVIYRIPKISSDVLKNFPTPRSPAYLFTEMEKQYRIFQWSIKC